MSTSLRVFLVACAVIVFIFVVHNLKRCRMQVLDSVFWLLFSTSFVVLGVFPEIASFFSNLLGFVFLYVVAVLVVRDFRISLRLSKQEERLNSLVQAAALDAKRK